MKNEYKIACNFCGAGKPLYFKRFNPSMINNDEPMFEYILLDGSEKRELIVSKLQCPKCDNQNVDILALLD